MKFRRKSLCQRISDKDTRKSGSGILENPVPYLTSCSYESHADAMEMLDRPAGRWQIILLWNIPHYYGLLHKEPGGLVAAGLVGHPRLRRLWRRRNAKRVLQRRTKVLLKCSTCETSKITGSTHRIWSKIESIRLIDDPRRYSDSPSPCCGLAGAHFCCRPPSTTPSLCRPLPRAGRGTRTRRGVWRASRSPGWVVRTSGRGTPGSAWWPGGSAPWHRSWWCAGTTTADTERMDEEVIEQVRVI